jgi:hypothetical protein
MAQSSQRKEPPQIPGRFNTNVASAKREVIEYIGDPKESPQFKEPRIIQDIEPVEIPNVKDYGVEGISRFFPIAWIDLTIKAQGASVEIL